MGAWVLASVLYACLLLGDAKNVGGLVYRHRPHPVVRPVRQTAENGASNGRLVGEDLHSATPEENNPEVSATNYQPYNVKVYKFSTEDARDINGYSPYDYENRYNDVGSFEGSANYKEFSSIEAESAGYNNQNEYFDTTGYNQYKTSSSFNLEGPRQLETITTQSFHREAEPYDVSHFEKHNEEEEHAEVHYHQHKHLHKHNHKQEHTHKHQQEHKHEHGHKHDHHAQHDHKHQEQHKHSHLQEHTHHHRAEHQHKHQQEHKHDHHAHHNHEHKHQQEHKHGHHHDHQHSHHNKHKHDHHQEHKHEHHHGHKHENYHKHNHDHHQQHQHHHGHKHDHKHQHHSKHHHKHQSHKY